MILDIVIPALNEEQNLIKLLPFLSEEPHRRFFNITVVDALRSDDNTQILCNENNVAYIKSTATKRSIQMNEGAKTMNGDCIMFLHADVQPPANFYKSISNAIENNFDAGCFSYRFDSNRLLLKINAHFTRKRGFHSGGGDQMQFIRRRNFEALGGFCEEHDIMEDFEFFGRVKKHQIPYTIINSPAKVSARKYKDNSWLKVNLINLIALLHYKVNQDPVKLRSFYNRWLY